MWVVPSILNSPHAVIPSAPHLAKPVLAPGNLCVFWWRTWKLKSVHVWFKVSLRRFIVETSASSIW